MLSTNDLIGLLAGGVIVLMCAALGILLYTGRGAMMIAGYNTLSEEERRKIDEKALCKAVGIYMIAVSAAVGATFCAAVFKVDWLAYAITGLITVGTIPFIIWVNRSKRFKK